MRDKLHVLIVDDSAVVRQAMTALLATAGDFTTAAAADPLIAIEKIRHQRPDVIVLDLEMPRMHGITFLRKIMAEDPIPVIVCSSLLGNGTVSAVQALSEGAVDVVAKPRLGVRNFIEESALMLADSIRAAALSKRHPCQPRFNADVILPPLSPRPSLSADHSLIAIGSSTGGTEALVAILGALPAGIPGLVVVQHMPEVFTRSFARRLDSLCTIEVREAQHGDRIERGVALLAPGNRHVVVTRRNGGLVTDLVDGPLVSRHRPSVDVLFRSTAQAAGRGAIGIILTGMGSDGAAGLLEMREAGAATIAQDEATCVVFGMPKEAIARNAAEHIVPLGSVAPLLRQLTNG